MTITSAEPTVTTPYVSVERVPGQLVLDAQVTPAPTRRVQQQIERRLFGVDGVWEVTADALGGFRINVANGLFDLDQVAEAVQEAIQATITGEATEVVRVSVRQGELGGWWMIETDHRHTSRKLLDLLADALHPPQFTTATEATRYSGGGYNILVWATSYWTQERVDVRVRQVINEFYAET